MVFRWLGAQLWNWDDDGADARSREARVEALIAEDAKADQPGGGAAPDGGTDPDGGVAPDGRVGASDDEEELPAPRRLTGKQALAKLRAQSSNTLELAGKLLQEWRLPLPECAVACD